MNVYLVQLQSIWNFLIEVLTQVFDLFVGNPIFISVFALWILDRVFGIFDLIKG